NPPALFPPDADLAALGGEWWVAHVKARQEKALARNLARSSVAYFLPMYEVRRESRGRSWRATLPLFPGYVFFCGDEDDRLGALKTARIARIIDVPDQRRLIGELTAIRRLTESGMSVDPYPSLATGRRCRVRSGPLRDVEGAVARRKGATRFVVEVSILGQGAAVEIDGDLLEPID
ncbi:unnamed protein product, partial [marine sediment metagenome]